MDGLSSDNRTVIVLGSTNRKGDLDPALLRPGRLDRHISLGTPDLTGRRQIYELYLKPLPIGVDLTTEQLAQKLAILTPGMTGAQIANVCNEAGLHAMRRKAQKVEEIDFDTAVERILVGVEKKSHALSAEERNTVAHHEAGHALCGWYLEHADPLLKISISTRDHALGFTQVRD